MKPTLFPLPLPAGAVLVSIATLCLLLAPAASTAQDWDGTCQLTVRQISADNSDEGVAGELSDIEKDLSKLAYSTYRLEETHGQQLTRDEAVQIEILGENRLHVTLEDYADSKLRLKVRLGPAKGDKKLFESVLRIKEGGTFILGGPAFGDGVLILALTAEL